MAQAGILAGYWLNERAARSLNGLIDQTVRAQWLEERYFKSLAKVMGTKE
ncbi:MAG: hypothetical protein HQL72_09080 [Magnetococcales bacterium]|nr:hypothetical protein [Magnetococcales bacterium]